MSEGRAYLHLQMSGLGAALRVLRVRQAGHAKGQGDLWAQHAAAQEAGGAHARLQRAEAARQPREHALLGAQLQYDCPRRPQPPALQNQCFVPSGYISRCRG